MSEKSPFSPFQESQIKRIFGTMINQKLQDFEEEVKATGDIITQVNGDSILKLIFSRILPKLLTGYFVLTLRKLIERVENVKKKLGI